MRNLKKILSLVLALMMVLSVMATASATDFVDDEDITYKEAVEVMASLGVLNGVKNEDGTYNFLPKETLNRAAGAKIVAYIANGGALDKQLMETLTNPFTDVAGWAVDSVKYCYDAGIINGISETLFDPTNSLDGFAFGKMMLEAAGYDWKSANGNTWKTKVATSLKANGLLAGIEDLVFGDPMTREQACQMAWNVMNLGTDVYTITFSANAADSAARLLCTGQEFATQIDAVRYALSVKPTATLVTTATAAGEFQINKLTTGSLYAENFDGKSVVVTVTSNGATVANQKYTGASGGKNFNYVTGLDELGKTYEIFYKDAGTMPADGYEVYGVTEVTTEVVITAAMTAAQVKDAFAAAGVTANIGANSISKIQNGAITANTNTAVVMGTTTGASIAGTYYVVDGAVTGIRLVDANVKVLTQVTAYTAPTASATGSITITGVAADGTVGGTAAITLQKIGSETPDVIALYEGIKANDYVYVTKVAAETMKVEAAKSVVATVTSLNTGAATIGLDGSSEDYAFVAVAGLTDPASAAMGTKYNVVFSADNTVAGVYAYVAPTESAADSYAMVLDVLYVAGEAASLANGNVATPAKVVVKVLLVDGTVATYTYTGEEATTVAALKTEMNYGGVAGTIAQWDVIKFAVEGNALTEVVKQAEATAVSAAAISDATAKVAAGVYMTASTPLVYQDPADLTADAKVVNGYAAAQAALAADVFFVTDDQGAIVVAFVKQAYVPASQIATNIAYIPANITGSTDGFYDADAKASRYNYTVYVDGVATTLVSAASDKTGTAGFVTYTLTNGLLSANLSSTVTGYTNLDGTIGFVDETTVEIGGTQKALAANVQIITDDTANNNGVSLGGTLAVGQTVKALFNAAGQVAYIVIIVPAAS